MLLLSGAAGLSNLLYDKTQPLLKATFWSWLVRLNVAGIVAALLVG